VRCRRRTGSLLLLRDSLGICLGLGIRIGLLLGCLLAFLLLAHVVSDRTTRGRPRGRRRRRPARLSGSRRWRLPTPRRATGRGPAKVMWFSWRVSFCIVIDWRRCTIQAIIRYLRGRVCATSRIFPRGWRRGATRCTGQPTAKPTTRRRCINAKSLSTHRFCFADCRLGRAAPAGMPKCGINLNSI
jgi:hypothetical protein